MYAGLASDVQALAAPHRSASFYLDDGEVVEIKGKGFIRPCPAGAFASEKLVVEINYAIARQCGFPHFMLKESLSNNCAVVRHSAAYRSEQFHC